MQDADPTIKEVLAFWKRKKGPNPEECKQVSKPALTLLKQWGCLVEQDAALRRRIQHLDRGEEFLQLVFSRSLNCGVTGLAWLPKWSIGGNSVSSVKNLSKLFTLVWAIYWPDFTILEPTQNGMENVLIITDVFTKYTQAAPTRDQHVSTVVNVLGSGFISFEYLAISTRTKDTDLKALSLSSFVVSMELRSPVPPLTILLAMVNASTLTAHCTTFCEPCPILTSKYLCI